MQYKFLGAALVVAGCGFFGILLAVNCRRETEMLRSLCSALTFMCCELGARMTPLPELCRCAGGHCDGGVRKTFLAIAEELDAQVAPDATCCVTAAVNRCPELPRRCRETFLKVGKMLGRFDLQGQMDALESARQECERERKELEDNQKQRLRTYKTLGFCAGAALAILLF